MEKWMNNKELLTKIFFSDKDTLQRETKDLEDFWSFLDKYERFKSKKRPQEPSILAQFDLDLPLRYDKKFKINFGYSSSVLQAKFQAHRLDHKDSKLTFDEIVDFQKVILYYLDFLQKKNFAKLMKLKREQNNLPIKQYEEQIVDAVTTNQVVIVAGDTGCGKSTQVPQYLLNAGVSNIACTQPRRLACISLAKRVGYETLNEYKSDIAYQVRFESSRTKRTKVVFLTEGLILRQLQTDPVLSMYDVIVVDEVHERHVNGDFLLGILKCLLTQRTDLKLILMSATINIDLFASYFHGAPVIQVPGRLYPIDLQYMPHFVKKAAIVEKADRLDPSPYLKIMQLIDDKYPSSERGDLLIFMSGMTEIQAVVDAAKEYALKHSKWIILPLHSSLSIQEQDKIFDVAPEGVRKCIVSTNIAETSITIDGVRFIADSGKVKEMSYDPQVKMQRLQEFWISQASAEQRKGRAGRTGPGVCYRLYSDEDYHEFSNYSTPEIHRVPLDTLVLQMASLGLHDATKFPFIEPPPKASLVNSMHFLKQQAALTPEGELTSLGRMLSRLPVDIVIGKMLIMGSLFSLVEPILVIATALSVQSPLTKRFNADPDCDTRRKELFSPHGDPFTLLNLYDEWILTKSDRSTNSRKWCKRRGVEEQRLYEMTKLKRQFEDLLRDHNLLRATRDTGSRGSEKERLLRLKREHRGQSSRKRKMLKMDEVEVSSDEDDDQLDINDIEFKLRHNLKKLEKTSNRRFTFHDINILKLIIASGLYPQLAAPDESNPFRKESEQTFHCKDKQFLMLHPTSVYALQPSFLEDFYFDKSCAQEARYVQSRELLLYVSLLETNKAYVVNTSRIPALQTLLLLSSKIETNADCSLVVFDQWLEMSFGKTFDGSGLLSKVVQIRKAWDTLLEQKLEIYELEDEKEIASKQRKLASLEKMVALKLAEFVDADIAYKLRRLSSADVKHLYNDTEGDLVTPYMRHGCIADTSDVYGEHLQEHYTCENCGLHMVCTVSERLAHHQKCSTEPPEQESEEESGEEEQCGIPKRHFECERCKQTFQFTTVEILKHKQSHAVD